MAFIQAGNGSSPEALIFQKMAKDIQRQYGVDKGFYLFSPSGIPLVRWTCHRDGGVDPDPDGKPVKIKNQLEGIQLALDRYQKLPKETRLLPENVRVAPSGRRYLPLSAPAGGFLWRMLSRNLARTPSQLAGDANRRAAGKPQSQTWRWNIHWVTASNADFLPTPLEVGAIRQVPEAFVRSLCTDHLIDSTGGQAGHLVPKTVTSAWMKSKVVKVEGPVVHLLIEGATDADNFDSKILGKAVWDGQKFTTFDLMAVGLRQGEGNDPLGFLFELSEGPLWHLKRPPKLEKK